MFYVEWASNPSSRKGRMVTMKALETLLKLRDPGYASYYMFKEEDALKIKEAGHSRELSQYEVASGFLIIDIDTGKDSLDYVLKCLEGLAYEVWESGGKGYHVYIPHDLIVSKNLPYSHRAAIIALIPDAEQHIDLSLYQHGRLLSLPGRIHPKTKKKKQFCYRSPGNEIKVEIVEPPKIEFNLESLSDLSMLTQGLDRTLNMVLKPPYPGNRHLALWGAAKDLRDSGLAYETVLDLMIKVNEQWELKKSSDEVALAVNQAFLVPPT